MPDLAAARMYAESSLALSVTTAGFLQFFMLLPPLSQLEYLLSMSRTTSKYRLLMLYRTVRP